MGTNPWVPPRIAALLGAAPLAVVAVVGPAAALVTADPSPRSGTTSPRVLAGDPCLAAGMAGALGTMKSPVCAGD